VTLYHNRDDNDIWVVQLHQSVAEKFHKPPTLAKISNVLNGSCIRLMHTETISVLAASNGNYKGGSKLREVYGG
jgi:dolichyl-phosphate-mannose--protein O-mannosyl transferase